MKQTDADQHDDKSKPLDIEEWRSAMRANLKTILSVTPLGPNAPVTAVIRTESFKPD